MDVTLKQLQGLDAEKVAKAVQFAATLTPEQITARKRGRPAGSVAELTKETVNLRLDPDVIEALRASGRGWQTRVNDLLRADIKAGRLKAVS
jgi:uncharacterized protein (DUF4415 family)